MHTTIDYTNRPAKQFDAVNDIMEYLGSHYAKIALDMAKVVNTEHFENYCGLAGIQGFPVRAWYNHFQGEGAWERAAQD